MKLPICQYSKLFLLLTAFSFLDSLKAGRATINSVQDISPSSASSASLLLSSRPTIESKSLQLEIVTTPYSKQHRGQNRTSLHRVGILMSSRILNTMKMQQGFQNFVDFFKVNLDNVTVDFIKDDGLSGFIKQLEGNEYTTIVKTLNNDGIDDDDDDDVDMEHNDSGEKRRVGNAVGYCHLMEGLSKNFNKTVLLWPCPRIKVSTIFYSITSYTVRCKVV